MARSAAGLTRDLELHEGAPLSQLAAALLRLQVTPPDDYIRFMSTSNGAEGPIGAGGYLALWSIERVGALNDVYHVTEFAPSLVLFGSDGGDTAYAFHRQRPGTIVAVPFVGMSDVNASNLGDSFAEFLERISVEKSE